jgi:hypothetical protein
MHSCPAQQQRQAVQEIPHAGSHVGHSPAEFMPLQGAGFMFVFEAGNRIVLEKPKYSHATYFIEIEEPLPISCQMMVNPLLSMSL